MFTYRRVARLLLASEVLVFAGCSSGVAPATPIQLTIIPNTSTMVVGTSQTFSVTEEGGTSGIPNTGPIPSWTVDDPSIATVTLAGQVTAIRAGTVKLTVAFEGTATTRVITVSP